MRFRYKVIMINIAFLSIALGILGFVIIHRNFRQSLDIQTSYAIEENNLIQASIEYRLLEVINQNKYDLAQDLTKAGEETGAQVLSDRSALFILYNDKLLYYSENDENITPDIPETLLDSLELGGKKYLTRKEADGYFLYVASKNIINDANLYIVTRRSAGDTYQLLYSQIRYFLLLMVVVLAVCSVFLYFICTYLTKPMEQLNIITDYIAQGEYRTQAEITSDDEIGMLAKKFNRMALAISEHMEELNVMVRQHEQFVADFTHEIKTPMTTIIGFADTLRSKTMTEERRQLAYQYIYSEGKRLEAMSMKLFDLIYLRDNEIEKSEIETTELAGEITKSMQPVLDRNDITLETEMVSSIIYGEPELLKTVFINLIDNARKASSPHTKILFRGFPKEDSYYFQVQDFGCGMNEETKQHICDEFYMADKSRTRAEGGAGLGMSLTALIIQKHGAVMNIQSEVGKGTVITISLKH